MKTLMSTSISHYTMQWTEVHSLGMRTWNRYVQVWGDRVEFTFNFKVSQKFDYIRVRARAHDAKLSDYTIDAFDENNNRARYYSLETNLATDVAGAHRDIALPNKNIDSIAITFTNTFSSEDLHIQYVDEIEFYEQPRNDFLGSDWSFGVLTEHTEPLTDSIPNGFTVINLERPCLSNGDLTKVALIHDASQESQDINNIIFQVWRLSGNLYSLVGESRPLLIKGNCASSCKSFHQWDLRYPIRVAKGDFIGIYSGTNANGVVESSIKLRGISLSNAASDTCKINNKFTTTIDRSECQSESSRVYIAGYVVPLVCNDDFSAPASMQLVNFGDAQTSAVISIQINDDVVRGS